MQHVFKTQNYHGHRSSYIDYGTVVLTEETVHSHPHHHLSIYLVTKMMLWNWPIWKQPIVDVEIYVKLLALLLSSGFSSMILFYRVLLEDKAHKLHIPANSNPRTAQKCSPKNSACERAHTKRWAIGGDGQAQNLLTWTKRLNNRSSQKSKNPAQVAHKVSTEEHQWYF